MQPRLSFTLTTMPIQAISDEQKAAAMAAGASDLKWLLADNQVSDEIQAVLFHFRFTSLKMFTGLGDSRAEVN